MDLFFISANVGLAISLAVPQVHSTVAMVCPMVRSMWLLPKPQLASVSF